MDAILDFSKPMDVGLLDRVVATMNNPADPQRKAADAVLTKFAEHPDAWTRVDAILEATTDMNTRYFALQVLEKMIKFRWRMLPAPQREVIRSYLVRKIIETSKDERSLAANALFINKMNLLLVAVLKQEWPHNWPSFIPDIVAASKSSEVLCENNVRILKLLSQEVFDFSKDNITSAKAEALRSTLTGEFKAIYDLCEFILKNSRRVSLIGETLRTLTSFATWIPDAYIFGTQLLPTLCTRFLPVPAFRVDTLNLLTEVAGMAKPPYDDVFRKLYMATIEQIVKIIPPHADVAKAYNTQSGADQAFVRSLALFLSSFFKAHVELLEIPPLQHHLVSGMEYLLKISNIDDQEVFKICLDYWQRLANDLYSIDASYNPMAPALTAAADGEDGMPPPVAHAGGAPPHPRKEFYKDILTRVRLLMIERMAKPEEVLIVKDESGEIVRETHPDTDGLATYKVMKETLVFLTHLDYVDTERIMLDKLGRQVDDSEWSLDAINTLSWAVGSISGTMDENHEKQFLVEFIKQLLVLCDAKRGKNNKAVVASCIMYVVGQYPRFLKAHWKFLKTVVMKLFEFMHEKHPGVQDMAVDTFLKIAQKCRRKFVLAQPDSPQSFIEELCDTLPEHIADLETHQVHTFYEAAGTMVSAHASPAAQQELTIRLLGLPNRVWMAIMKKAAGDISVLQNEDTLREIQRILRTNVFTCRAVGPAYDKQLGGLYMDMLNVYKALSGLIKSALTARGPNFATTPIIKAMRNVKKEILNLFSTFVNTVDDIRLVASHFLPPLLEQVLPDYAGSIKEARDAEVLSMLGDTINRLRQAINADVPRIFTSVFYPTLEMITSNFEDYPDHRKNFFQLLQALNAHCFPAIFSMPPPQQKLLVDSIVWAFKHTAPDIGETGLDILRALLENVASAGRDAAQPFFQVFYLPLLQDLLQVLTDRLHKAHFKLHAAILRHLFHLVESGLVIAPLWESPLAVATGASAAYKSKVAAAAAANGGVPPPGSNTNQQFVREYVRVMISNAFKNLTPVQVQRFVDGLFDMARDLKAYKAHLRDFLVEVLEFKADNDLYSEERAAQAAADLERRRAVPGLLNPYQLTGTADDDDL